ncbi:MAG: hypothetical protein JXO22_03310 [Phycisphaerae bacterium]|nr:hypothetical protein [Phycisphaerae bacterium]
MLGISKKRFWSCIAVLAGSTFFLGDCDPTLAQTLEDGLITTASSLVTSWVDAFLQLATEAASA